MRRIRLYVDLPLATGQGITLSEAAANHAVRVLRLREGDAAMATTTAAPSASASAMRACTSTTAKR